MPAAVSASLSWLCPAPRFGDHPSPETGGLGLQQLRDARGDQGWRVRQAGSGQPCPGEGFDAGNIPCIGPVDDGMAGGLQDSDQVEVGKIGSIQGIEDQRILDGKARRTQRGQTAGTGAHHDLSGRQHEGAYIPRPQSIHQFAVAILPEFRVMRDHEENAHLVLAGFRESPGAGYGTSGRTGLVPATWVSFSRSRFGHSCGAGSDR